MTNNEKLIEEARSLQPTWHRGMYGSRDDMYANVKPLVARLADALEAAEKAHTPTANGIGRRHLPSRWEETVRIIESVALPQGSLPTHEAEQIADAVLARSECLHWTPDPEGEPSDVQVEAGCVAFYEHATGLTSWERLVEYDTVLADRYRDGIRRALRAATATT